MQHSRVIGESAPAWLSPPGEEMIDHEPVDLIFWGPSASGCWQLGGLQLTLVDFFYLLVDAVSIIQRCDYERAFRACLEQAGRYQRLFQDAQEDR